MKNPIKAKYKPLAAALAIVVAMVAGYYLINWGVRFANDTLDQFAIHRVEDRHLVSPSFKDKTVYVTTPAAIQKAVADSVSSSVAPAVDEAVRNHLK